MKYIVLFILIIFILSFVNSRPARVFNEGERKVRSNLYKCQEPFDRKISNEYRSTYTGVCQMYLPGCRKCDPKKEDCKIKICRLNNNTIYNAKKCDKIQKEANKKIEKIRKSMNKKCKTFINELTLVQKCYGKYQTMLSEYKGKIHKKYGNNCDKYISNCHKCDPKKEKCKNYRGYGRRYRYRYRFKIFFF
jgi:hypothetical protein